MTTTRLTTARGERIMSRALLALLFAAACAVAQWQVNPQVGQVNNRVGGEMYGNMGSVRYATQTSNLLPSEARYATWRSGALPSEVRMNARAVGPLAPSGAIAYVPGPSPLQQAYKTPPPPLYNSGYGIQNKPIDTQLRPQPGYASGSVKYAATPAPVGSGPAPMSAAVTGGWKPPAPGQMNTGQQPTRNIPTAQPSMNTVPGTSGQSFLNTGPATPGAQLFSQSPSNLGSIRYESLSKTATLQPPPIPATPPATQRVGRAG
jgi:hypothetical protein